MKMNKIYSTLGLAMKSGSIVSGELGTEKAIKSYKAELVIISEDASDNTQKKFRNMCDFYKTPMITFGTKEQLGHAIGKELRSSIAILNQGFAESIASQLKQDNS